MATYEIHGHAIVSADDRIAAADGRTPPALRNAADWRRFQAALDRAAVIVLGRLGHEHNPNLHRRNRLVLSSGASGVEHRDDAWWWNPADAPLAEALARAAPRGGIVAVPGGRRVFDLFLEFGYDAFDLARAANVFLPDGIPIFVEVLRGRSADDILSARLALIERISLDPAVGVSLTLWRKGQSPA